MIKADRQESQESEIRTKLKSLDPLLDIRYVEWIGRYSLVCMWPQSDGRWPMYHKGEIGEPFDSLGWFCKDMGDPSSLPISLDDIENLVIERLAACDNTREDWKSRMAGHIKHNQKVKKDRQKIALDQVEEVTSTLRHAVGHLEEVQVNRIMKEIESGKH